MENTHVFTNVSVEGTPVTRQELDGLMQEFRSQLLAEGPVLLKDTVAKLIDYATRDATEES